MHLETFWRTRLILALAPLISSHVDSVTDAGETERFLSNVGIDTPEVQRLAEVLRSKGVEQVCDLSQLTDHDLKDLGFSLVRIRKLQSRLRIRCASGENTGLNGAKVNAKLRPLAVSGKPRRTAAVAAPPPGLSAVQRRTLLHERLLDGYDFGIPPSPLSVGVNINFFKLVDVDLKSSQLILGVWFRCSWIDPRLQWNDTEWNMSYTVIQADTHSLENSLVWTPDLELYNGEQSITSTLQTKPIQIQKDGSIYWSRPGTLRALCKFRGLSKFPWDELSCKLELGAWSLDGGVQDIVISGKGFSGLGSGNSGETSGSTFQDYNLTAVEIERKEIWYDGYSSPNPELIYTVYLKRSSSFYVWKLIIPQICMAILSFIPYFMSPECGERLGFGITLVLAILTTDVLSMDLQPVCEEELLMDDVTRMCFFFCVISLLESAVVIFVFFLEESSIWDYVPHRVKACVDKVACKSRWTKLRAKSSAKGLERSQSGWVEDGKNDVEKQLVDKLSPGKTKELSTKDVSKLSFRVRQQLCRQAFYCLDNDFSGHLDPQEISKFGEFMLGNEWSEARTKVFMEAADRDKSGALTMDEFCKFCERMVLDNDVSKEVSYVKDMIQGFITTMKYEREQAIAHWHFIAQSIDTFFRYVVPPSFLIALLARMNHDYLSQEEPAGR